MTNSIGIIETRSLAFAGESLNQILKVKEIELLNIEFPGKGLITVFLFGEYSKIKNSLEIAENLSASFTTYFKGSIITKPDEKLFKLLKAEKKEATKLRQESIEKKEVKKQSNVTLDVTPAKTAMFVKDEVKDENKVEFDKTEKVIGLKQKSVTEKNAISGNLKVKSFKSRVDNPTIARLKQEALGRKIIEQEKNSIKGNNDEQVQQSEMTLANLELLNVHKLRHYARSFSGFPIKGREISKANREELLNHFKQLI